MSCLTLSEEAKHVLQDLFTSYPPDDGELSEGALRNCSEVTSKLHRKPDSSFCKPSMRKGEIAKKVELLARRMTEDPHLRKVLVINLFTNLNCFFFLTFNC